FEHSTCNSGITACSSALRHCPFWHSYYYSINTLRSYPSVLPFPVNRTLQPRFSPKSRCFCLLSPSCFFATFNVLTFQRANAVCAPYPRYLGSPTSGYGARVLISPTSLHPYVIASIFGTLFHFPYLLSPLFATLTKTAGVYAISSRFGDPPV